MFRLLTSLFCVLFTLLPIQAVELQQTRTAYALTKPMTVQDLKDSASIIFRGSFEDFKLHEQNGLNARSLKFKVKEAFKGLETKAKKLILTEWARTRSPFTEDLIASDKDYVFFFYEPSDSGFTSLVGMEQGMITVNKNKKLKFSPKVSNKKHKKRSLFFFSKEQNIESYQDLKDFLGSKS